MTENIMKVLENEMILTDFILNSTSNASIFEIPMSKNNSILNTKLNESDLCGGNFIIIDPTLTPPRHQQQLSLTFEFLIIGLGIIIVASLGIIGNILSAIVLSRPQMKSSVTCLLLALAFCDSLLISLSTLIFGLPAMSDFSGSLKSYRHIYYPLMVPYLYPISITAQTSSVYITLAVTIERYIAVCHPLRARSLCTWKRARYGVIGVFTGSLLYNLSRWWEVCTCTKGFDLHLNATVYENFMCPLRQNGDYINIYVNWSYLLVMYLIPISGLVVLNWAIYRQVRKANRERQVLSKLQKREMGLATMLLFVVAVFLVCNILPLVNNILESFYSMEVDLLVQCSNFLVVFNSSVNFVIYCTCGERFRRLLFRLARDLIWCRIGPRSDSLRNSLRRKSHFYRGHHNGGDFEEMSLGSMNNHSCLTTAMSNGGNPAILVDMSLEKPGRRLNNFRNRTLPNSNSPSNPTTTAGVFIGNSSRSHRHHIHHHHHHHHHRIQKQSIQTPKDHNGKIYDHHHHHHQISSILPEDSLDMN